MIAPYITQDNEKWSDTLPVVLHAYNTLLNRILHNLFTTWLRTKFDF